MTHQKTSSKSARRATVAAFVLLFAGGLAVAEPAAAASAAVINCTATWDWFFWPPLDLSGQSGEVFVQSSLVHNVCPFVAVQGLGAQEELFLFAGAFTAPYVGDCVHATVFMPDGEIHVVGSTVIAGFGGSNGVSWQLEGTFVVPPCGVTPGLSVVDLSAEAADLKEVTIAAR